MTTIGSWVRRQRLKRRLSQGELGEALRKSRTWVSSLERGTFRPRVEDCAALGAFFGVDLGEVLSLAGYPLSEIANLRQLASSESATATETAAVVITLTPDELRKMLQEAADAAVARVMEEWAKARADAERVEPPPPSRQ